eukprot:8648820-Pyramimonas_sp.AAC.1
MWGCRRAASHPPRLLGFPGTTEYTDSRALARSCTVSFTPAITSCFSRPPVPLYLFKGPHAANMPLVGANSLGQFSFTPAIRLLRCLHLAM